jgi:hypothetical protein
MIHYFFYWYNGAIYSNILASAMWFIPGYLWGRYHVKRIHSKVQEIHDHLNPTKSFKLGENHEASK